MVGICTVLALRGGTNVLTLVTLRSLGTLAIFIAYFRAAGISLTLTPRERWIALGLALPVCINTYCINAAIAEIPVPLAVLIFYLWPAIVTSVSWIARTEPFRWRGVAGLVLAFVGIALALNVDLSTTQEKGVLLALMAAISWATVFLLMHHFFRGRDTRPVTFHMSVVVAVIFVAVTPLGSGFVLPTLPVGWEGVIGVTLFYAFGTIAIFAASAQVGPSRVGFYMNFEPIATVTLAALILGQTLAPVQLAGATLIVLALFLFRPPPLRQN